LLTANLSRPAEATAHGLVEATTATAARFAGSGGDGAGVSARVAALAEAALRGVTATRLKVAALVFVVCLAAGLGVLAGQPLTPRTPPAKADPTEAKPPRTDLLGDPLPPGALARMGTVRFRLPGKVKRVAFSPDGETILAYGGPVSLFRADD